MTRYDTTTSVLVVLIGMTAVHVLLTAWTVGRFYVDDGIGVRWPLGAADVVLLTAWLAFGVVRGRRLRHERGLKTIAAETTEPTSRR